MDKKIILTIPKELKEDLSNTKSLDKEEENERFFEGVDLFGEIKILNWTITNFQNEWNYNLEKYKKLLNTICLYPKDVKEFKQVKSKLYYLEMFYKKNFGEGRFFQICDNFSFEISKYYGDDIKKELNAIHTEFDRVNKFVFAYKSRGKIESLKLEEFNIKPENLKKVFEYYSHYKGNIKIIITNILKIFIYFIVNPKYILYLISDYFLLKSINKKIKNNDNIIKIILYSNLKDFYTNSLKSLDEKILSESFASGLNGSNVRNLSLNGLKELPKDFASGLNGSKVSISLNGLQELPKDFASGLKYTNVNGLSLNGLKELPKDFASGLKDTKVNRLYLNGLKELPKDFASGLKDTKVNWLYLNGLKELPKDFASGLKDTKVNWLYLNGLKELPKDFASGLNLILNGLKELPKDFFIGLKDTDDSFIWLELNGLKELPKDFVSGLKDTKVEYLYLNGLKELPKDFVSGLKDTKVEYLYLNGLKELPKDFFIGLKDTDDSFIWLELNGLKELPKDFVSGLKYTKVEYLYLNGLKELPKDFVSGLKYTKVERLSLNGLKELPTDFVSGLNESNINELSLDGLKELPTDFVSGLKYTKVNRLDLNGLKELPTDFVSGLKYTKVKYLYLNSLIYIEKENYITPQRQELKQFIKDYDSGSCLVSGYRGVGKTSSIKMCINEYKKEEKNINIIRIIINVPEKSEKSFDKNELINRIIVKIFEEIEQNKNIPISFKNKIFEQYQRVYNQIETSHKASIESNKTIFKINLKNIIFGILFIGVPYNFYKYSFSIIFILPTGLGALIIGTLTSVFYNKYEQKQIREKTIKELYTPDIAESKLVNNLSLIRNGYDIGTIFEKYKEIFKNFVEKLFSIKIFFLSVLLVFITLGWSFGMNKYYDFLDNINYVVIENTIKVINFYEKENENSSKEQPKDQKQNIGENTNNTQKIIRFLKDIETTIQNLNFSTKVIILSILLYLLACFVIKFIEFYKPTKFIFVIDELDKLLDFEKTSGQKELQKHSLDMAQVFEVLSKLKILFFDTKGAIFFVVTNKQAYDYYLLNKHQEDDLISNIFNKIIYLPANDIENFNISHKVDIVGDIDIKEEDLKENEKPEDICAKNRVLRDKLKKYFYFKSHGNWRKAKFELSNRLKGDKISISKKKFDFEYNFYEFFDKLNEVFEKGSLDNDEINKFLFSMNKKNKGYVNQMYDEQIEVKENEKNKIDTDFEKIKETMGDEFYNLYIKNIHEKFNIKKQEITENSKKHIEEVRKNVEENGKEEVKELVKKGNFYTVYLERLKELLKKNIEKYYSKETNNELYVNIYLEYIEDKFRDKIDIKDFFGYFIGSQEKISQEYAYKDYILNYLLNIYENINFSKKTNLDEIFKNIKINETDLEYPVFADLVLFWLPLMLVYFYNIKIYE